MLGLLGLVPSGIKMALLAGLLVSVAGFYWHYTVVKGERDSALAQVGALTVAKAVQDVTIGSQRKAIAEWTAAQARMQQTLAAMAKSQVESNKVARKLNNVLAKHDMLKLSLARPKMVERRINRGTASILKLLNAASGGRTSNGGKDRPAKSKAGPTRSKAP